MIVQKVLRDGPFTMRGLAEAAGLRYQTVRSWAAGMYTPQPDSVLQLAKGIRSRIEVLEEMAEELERAAERGAATAQ